MSSSSQHHLCPSAHHHGSSMDPDPPLWSHRQPQLSLFQQTLLENDEIFYKTFPAARLALQLNQTEPVWRPHYQLADFAGYSFQPDYQPLAHSPPTHRPDAAHCVSQFYTLHDQMTPRRMPPNEMLHEPSSDLAPPSPHIATSLPPDMQYLPQYTQPHPHSPESDSLASSGSFSHTLYQHPPHLGTSPPISSPTHSDFPPPVTPPALVPSILSPVQTEPEQHYITDQPYSPSSAPPSRRDSQHQITTYRSQRRYSPLFNHTPHQTHKSGGSVPVMEWTTTPPPTTTVNTNIGSSLANAVSDIASPAAPAVATLTASVSSPSGTPEARPLQSEPVPGSNNTNTGGNSKRNPDKKPALACVFCRGRKIACGPPLKDGDGKSCNQCQRRSLRCEYPTESRRGMRKKPAIGSTTPSASSSMKAKRNTNASSNAKFNASPSSPKLVVKNKRR